MTSILDYQETPPSVLARFWWSDAAGITCDNPSLAAWLKHQGIVVPSNRLVYPSDGRVFFDALPFGFKALEKAQPPIEVQEQGGEPI